MDIICPQIDPEIRQNYDLKENARANCLSSPKDNPTRSSEDSWFVDAHLQCYNLLFEKGRHGLDQLMWVHVLYCHTTRHLQVGQRERPHGEKRLHLAIGNRRRIKKLTSKHVVEKRYAAIFTLIDQKRNNAGRPPPMKGPRSRSPGTDRTRNAWLCLLLFFLGVKKLWQKQGIYSLANATVAVSICKTWLSRSCGLIMVAGILSEVTSRSCSRVERGGSSSWSSAVSRSAAESPRMLTGRYFGWYRGWNPVYSPLSGFMNSQQC